MAQRQDVELLMHAMFMKLQLKMRQKEISAETEALDQVQVLAVREAVVHE